MERPPLGIRLLRALVKDRDWSTMSADELAAFSEAENRKRASRAIRLITGFPDRRADIRWDEVALADRVVRVRVYRPVRRDGDLPLVLHVHGGGFVGTAVQCDWVNSHLAARLAAVVVSVEHRLLAPGTPLPAAFDDAWDVLLHIVGRQAEWGIDPARTAIAGESTGALIAALAAIKARGSGPLLRAQVLVNPPLDLTDAAYDHASAIQHADCPTLPLDQMRLFLRLAVPPGVDARAVSPLHADDLAGLPPALIVVPTVDPVADQGRRYADRLRESGTPVQLAEHRGAPHAFLSMPGLVPHARAARAEIACFLRDHLRSADQGRTAPAHPGER